MKAKQIAPKTPVNWRIRTDILIALKQDCQRLGIQTIPALINYLLVNHYFGSKKLKNSGDR